ncbi:MAG TPA: SDR family oxidoreductase [Spongiibacteraceae bacterium]|nr:SDR family oxidoreductase [Spongiibacteraceae bacterium]
MLLKDKVLIISGIGPGLGVKLAVEAAREGAKGLVIAARGTDKLDDAEKRVRELGVTCKIVKVPTDISVPAQCKNLVEVAMKEFGRIDALINSAYFHGNSEPIMGGDLELWKTAFNTNVIGSVELSRAVAPHMAAQGGGAIVIVNTMATMKPLGGEAGYAISKGALTTATKYLAAELGPQNIRVNATRMGWMWGVPVQTGLQMMADAQGLKLEDVAAGIAQNIALRRIVTDDECSRSVLFLASDYASAVSGAILDVNGGEYIPS